MKTRFNPFLILAVALATGTSLPAAILYWDGTDTSADANGGAGTWDTTTTNWDDAATAGSSVSWPAISTGDDDASFGAPGGAVTIDAAGITANSLTFTAASYVLSGGKITLDGIDPDGAGPLLTPAPIITAGPTSTGQSATINSAIASARGLSKSGGSTLVLGGDLSQVVGTLTIDGAIASPVNNNGGVQIQAGVSTSGLTSIDIKNNSFLALAGSSLAGTTSIILNGGGGTQAPQGAIRGTAGNSTIAGPVTINDAAVRIGNTGTSTTFSGAITAATSTHGLLIRIGSNQGVILTNTGNSWSGVTNLGEGSLYCAPGALPATSNLAIGSSAGADFGTNGTFSRPLGTDAGQVTFGRATDGLRPMGFTARGGALTVNIGGAAADFTFLATTLAATTNATFVTTSANVTVASATGIAIGHYVSGTGIAPDTRVTAVTGTTVTLSRNPTVASAASPGNSLTFTTLAAADVTKFGTYTLVLNGGNADSALTFQNPIDLNGFNRFLQTNANTATLTGGLKNSSASTASARKTGAGTLIHDPGAAHAVSLLGLNTNAGTLELKSGTVTVTGSGGTSQSEGTSGFIVARSGTFRLSGATVNVTGGGSVFTAGNTNGGGNTSNFILDSGTFDGGTKEVLNAYGAAGTTTINGGFFSCGTFRVSQNTGFLNLNGGTLRTSNLSNAGTATVSFNGGVLQARAANSNFIAANINTTRIQAGGAIIDSNGFAITIPEILTEDSGSTGGGLTKRGNGILDLTADNTYTGTNLIEGGVLRVASTTQLGVPTAPVTVNGGEFGVSGTGIPSISSLARTFTYTTGGFHVADAAHTLNVDIALTGSAALSKSGPGVITLSGANDFTGGITMGSGANGWIEVDSATDLGTGTKIANMASSTGTSTGGIRLLGNVTVSDVALNIGGRSPNPTTAHALLNVSGNNKWTGNINIVNSGGTYFLRSDAGQLELSGTLSNAQPENITSDTRAFNLEGAGDYLISGTIADGVNANRFTSLVMEGTGTATLTGTNTYTGTTQVKFGTLALVGGSQASPITVDSDATLGFTAGSPTTSTSTVTFAGANPKVKVTGTPVAGTLMTATSITGTPVLDPAIPGFELAITGGGTTLVLVSTSSDNYETWATTNGVTGQASNLDHDNDGVSNGVEYFIGGPNGNTTGFTALPSVTTVGGVRSITWTKAATYTGVYNTDFVVETSDTLGAGSWTTEPSPGTVTVSGNNVTYTFPAGPAIKFARLKVTGP
jgi:fibronectin-binding autotransporter adhesin